MTAVGYEDYFSNTGDSFLVTVSQISVTAATESRPIVYEWQLAAVTGTACCPGATSWLAV